MAAYIRSFSLFPNIALPRLSRMRGRKWTRLVERVAELPETHAEHMAYTLVMRRLAYEVGTSHAELCTMPGCVTCALEILERYEGSERDLLEQYQLALAEVRDFVSITAKAAVNRAA